ncbi:hypothetical protein VFPPC_18489 [Pochonia chlamydosporia 170]|uniref:Uncharacterized protein n=1 Tax=Pochonia chlamydosporia 170 TaxID=1380566 RepID=A0A219ANF7_METCM|nr:hypothetical protein VFPPC_18489 [Pochonia chlamydosporia 170]OWT42378.1 hypothetical protein VFPPC_18489 [Pochonia chlamydosporia 170]
MCVPVQDHCPSCHQNDGEVYRHQCPVGYEFRPGSYAAIVHTVDESNPMIIQVVCKRCRRAKAQTWIQRQLSWRLTRRRKRINEDSCQVCQNGNKFREEPLRIDRTFIEG